jgi:hypothetical protein
LCQGIIVFDKEFKTTSLLQEAIMLEETPKKLFTGVSAKVAAADTKEQSDDNYDDDNASAPLLSPNDFTPKRTENHDIPKIHGNGSGVTVMELSSPTPVKVKEEEQEDSEGSVTDDGYSDEEILVDHEYSQQQNEIWDWKADKDFGSPDSIKALSKRHHDEHKKKVKPSFLNPNSVEEPTRRSNRGRKNKN